jgi:hypothetical protein
MGESALENCDIATVMQLVVQVTTDLTVPGAAAAATAGHAAHLSYVRHIMDAKPILAINEEEHSLNSVLYTTIITFSLLPILAKSSCQTCQYVHED